MAGHTSTVRRVRCGLHVAVPPTDEQTAIAAFLDRETAKIDGLVAEQRRLIELLKEKRQAVISHAVTKGLNPRPHEALRHRMARRRAGALGDVGPPISVPMQHSIRKPMSDRRRPREISSAVDSAT